MAEVVEDDEWSENVEKQRILLVDALLFLPRDSRQWPHRTFLAHSTTPPLSWEVLIKGDAERSSTLTFVVFPEDFRSKVITERTHCVCKKKRLVKQTKRFPTFQAVLEKLNKKFRKENERWKTDIVYLELPSKLPSNDSQQIEFIKFLLNIFP